MMRRILIASWLIVFLCPHFLLAQGTKLWVQSTYDEFEKGQPQSVAINSNGYLESGPALRQVLLTPSTYIWALASDGHGNAYVATGSPATVLKISPNGVSTKLFSTMDLSVQAVAVGPDGSVYAATLPDGKVYRISPNQSNLNDSSAALVFDPATLPHNGPAQHDDRAKYIWDLAFDRQGELYIATGGPAAIYRVDLRAANAKPELFFSSDEQHIRCLLFESGGSLIAGSDGTGLVYKIGEDGKGIVLYDAPKREVTALAEGPGGQLYVASVGEKAKSNLPPLPVQGGSLGTATITIVAPRSVQASSSNGLVPEGSEIDELSPQGAPRKLWASPDDVAYALRATSQGLLAATGNRGKIYRILEDGTYTDLARAASGQATAFANAPDGTYVATSNTGRLYMLGGKPAANGTYLSDVFDAGVVSNWGRVEVNADEGGASGPFDLFARFGNIENPERNWSPWLKVTPNDPRPGNQLTRFVQWKAVLEPGARLSSVGVNYLEVNIAPVVDEIVVEPGARVNPPQPQPQPQVSINLPSQGTPAYTQDASTQPLTAVKDRTAITIRWGAHDDNGDQMLYNIYYRGDGEKDWRLLRSNLRDTYYSFDSIRLPDGGYRVKIAASDAPSHPAGQALTGDRVSEHFVIDTTPPAISSLTARLEAGKVHASFQAADATSPVTRAEYSLDAGPWRYLQPVGKLSDSLTERYDFTIPLGNAGPRQQSAADTRGAASDSDSDPLSDSGVSDSAEHVLAVRAYDRYENVSASKVVIH